MVGHLLWSCGVARTTLPPQLAYPALQQPPCRQALASQAGYASPPSKRPPGEVPTRGYSPMRRRTIRRNGSRVDWRGGIVDTERAQPCMFVLLSPFRPLSPLYTNHRLGLSLLPRLLRWPSSPL